MKFLLGILVLYASVTLAAPPTPMPKPGGIAVIDLGHSPAMPAATLDEQPVLVMQDGQRWLAVVGIPLSAEAGSLTLLAEGAQADTYTIDVVPHSYREQHLNVERRYVDLDEEQLARYQRERTVIDAVLNSHSERDVDDMTLPAPVPGRQSPSFGFRRVFNGQPRAPHSGMDITANLGTPVAAPLGGRVAAVGDYYFNGNTVLLDHGRGFVTMYCHLHRIDVEEGMEVVAGDTLGQVGATGRVTGAHLHFGVYLNGTAIDPALLIANQVEINGN